MASVGGLTSHDQLVVQPRPNLDGNQRVLVISGSVLEFRQQLGLRGGLAIVRLEPLFASEALDSLLSLLGTELSRSFKLLCELFNGQCFRHGLEALLDFNLGMLSSRLAKEDVEKNWHAFDNSVSFKSLRCINNLNECIAPVGCGLPDLGLDFFLLGFKSDFAFDLLLVGTLDHFFDMGLSLLLRLKNEAFMCKLGIPQLAVELHRVHDSGDFHLFPIRTSLGLHEAGVSCALGKVQCLEDGRSGEFRSNILLRESRLGLTILDALFLLPAVDFPEDLHGHRFWSITQTNQLTAWLLVVLDGQQVLEVILFRGLLTNCCFVDECFLFSFLAQLLLEAALCDLLQVQLRLGKRRLKLSFSTIVRGVHLLVLLDDFEGREVDFCLILLIDLVPFCSDLLALGSDHACTVNGRSFLLLSSLLHIDLVLRSGFQSGLDRWDRLLQMDPGIREPS